MNRDDIIRMAQEAGISTGGHPMNPWNVYPSDLERFAALVAAAEREAYQNVHRLLEAHQAALEASEKPGPWPAKEVIAKAVAAEREACVDIIEAYQIPVGNSAAGELACEWTYDALHEIRDDIRARGEG